MTRVSSAEIKRVSSLLYIYRRRPRFLPILLVQLISQDWPFWSTAFLFVHAQKAEREASELKGTMKKRMDFLDMDWFIYVLVTIQFLVLLQCRAIPTANIIADAGLLEVWPGWRVGSAVSWYAANLILLVLVNNYVMCYLLSWYMWWRWMMQHSGIKIMNLLLRNAIVFCFWKDLSRFVFFIWRMYRQVSCWNKMWNLVVHS